MKISRLLTVVLVLLMMTTLFAGCNKEEASSGKEPSKEQKRTTKANEEKESSQLESEEEKKYSEKLTLKVMLFNPRGFAAEKTDDLKKIVEEKYNVEFDKQEIDIFNKDQVNLFFAEGNDVDVIYTVGTTNWRNLVKQGVLRSISEEMLYEFAPNHMEALGKCIDPDIIKEQIYFQDKVWGLPISGYTSAMSYIMVIRKDWMDNLGITDIPENMDEFYNIAKRFTFDDPDKNGKDDTYGLGNIMYSDYFQGAFGIAPSTFSLKDGKVNFSGITEEYKQFLKTVQTWYKEGIIDPEMFTDSFQITKNKWSEGKIGFMSQHPWHFFSTTPTNLGKMVTDKNPEAEIVPFAALKGPEGKSGAWIPYPDVTNANGIYFGRNATDEKVIRFLQIKDDFANDLDWWIRCQYGEEGIDYSINDNGIIQPSSDMTAEYIRDKGLQYYNTGYSITPDVANKYLIAQEDEKLTKISYKNPVVYGSWGTPPLGFNFTGDMAEIASAAANLKDIQKEFYVNAIAGSIDIDSEWDNYKQMWLDNGGEKTLEFLQNYIDNK